MDDFTKPYVGGLSSMKLCVDMSASSDGRPLAISADFLRSNTSAISQPIVPSDPVSQVNASGPTSPLGTLKASTQLTARDIMTVLADTSIVIEYPCSFGDPRLPTCHASLDLSSMYNVWKWQPVWDPRGGALINQNFTNVTAPASVSPPVGLTPFVPANVATPPGNVSILPGWQYSGCFSDSLFPRALSTWYSSVYTLYDAATNEGCMQQCSYQNLHLAGTEDSGNCFCGEALVGSVQLAESECNVPCASRFAGTGEMCGGKMALSVYRNPSSNGPVMNPGPPGWKALGCYAYGSGAEFPMQAPADKYPSMTVAVCTGACDDGDFSFAALQGRNVCWCGDRNLGMLTGDGCNVECWGNSTELCGGLENMNVYQKVDIGSQSVRRQIDNHRHLSKHLRRGT